MNQIDIHVEKFAEGPRKEWFLRVGADLFAFTREQGITLLDELLDRLGPDISFEADGPADCCHIHKEEVPRESNVLLTLKGSGDMPTVARASIEIDHCAALRLADQLQEAAWEEQAGLKGEV